jgi:predicted DsbA family dithiol-disulfide isomerase
MELSPSLRVQLTGTSEHLKEMAADSGLVIVTPDVVPNSRRALEAAEYARAHGRHESFHKAVFRKLYGEGQDISRWTVLGAAAKEVGLDPEAMQRETENGEYRTLVDEHIWEAQALGITAVPTYVFADKYAIVGAQPYTVFQEAMAWLTGQMG